MRAKSVVFAFKSKSQAKFVQKHIRYDVLHKQIDDMTGTAFMFKTHYNPENMDLFMDAKELDKSKLLIEEQSEYRLKLLCDLNNIHLSVIRNVSEMDDGDIMLAEKDMGKFGNESIYQTEDIGAYNLNKLL
jgi:hypothetical protein